jgi:predicted transcriptional regulator
MKKDGMKTLVISFRASENEVNQLDELCKALDKSRGDTLRYFVMHGLDVRPGLREEEIATIDAGLKEIEAKLDSLLINIQNNSEGNT